MNLGRLHLLLLVFSVGLSGQSGLSFHERVVVGTLDGELEACLHLADLPVYVDLKPMSQAEGRKLGLVQAPLQQKWSGYGFDPRKRVFRKMSIKAGVLVLEEDHSVPRYLVWNSARLFSKQEFEACRSSIRNRW